MLELSRCVLGNLLKIYTKTIVTIHNMEEKMREKIILDWEKYKEKSVEMVSEGIVMLKNENHALPLQKGQTVAVFGRIQYHYYKSGTGSGGLVNVPEVICIPEGLEICGIKIEPELRDTYAKWIESHPFEMGSGWGEEPWCQDEMPLDDYIISKSAAATDTAIVIIGRTAGEEQDNSCESGSFLLTSLEQEMLSKVRNAFPKMIVLLNVGNIMDTGFIEDCAPDCILYVWQGGMVGGLGTAKVLCGEVSPSGKLTDTVAYSISDYPSDAYFGGKYGDCYTEDIYVGYRYFETFAPEAVKYPFGYGLSYTSFEIKTKSVQKIGEVIEFQIIVKNIGDFPGKEVIQVYAQAPQGKLGKPKRVLCGFEKTNELKPNESEELTIYVKEYDFSSYDDNGASGYTSCYVLEEGTYTFYVGTDVHYATSVYEWVNEQIKVVDGLQQALAPVQPFRRMKPVSKKAQSSSTSFAIGFENVPLLEIPEEQRRKDYLPLELPLTGNQGFKLQDVLEGRISMEQFIAQLSPEQLNCLVRGEGMGSPRVTPGTASAFGGVSDELQKYGIPCGCCADGPSGMRLDCGTKAFSLPNGTLIAASFNRQLATDLFQYLGMEMTRNKVDCILGPGMNIHRHPLNGRNFEYFSEDPFLTGHMAIAELSGLEKAGVTGTIKHFCGNNQEYNRHFVDSVISERALREIYLKGFELAVRSGKAKSVMTTYGKVNGLWTAGNYDLVTTILRREWGFRGFVMTDWWANINDRQNPEADKTLFSAMVKAQNDVYMVCSDGSSGDDDIQNALASGSLKLGELQRCAMNVCRFLLNTHAMERMTGQDTEVELINAPDFGEADQAPVQFYDMPEVLELPLENIITDKGSSYCFGLIINTPGYYKVTITASSTQSELAQIPLTIFNTGTASGTFTWNGTNGKPVSYCQVMPMFSHFTTLRLYFAQSGLFMHSLKIELEEASELAGVDYKIEN